MTPDGGHLFHHDDGQQHHLDPSAVGDHHDLHNADHPQPDQGWSDHPVSHDPAAVWGHGHPVDDGWADIAHHGGGDHGHDFGHDGSHDFGHDLDHGGAGHHLGHGDGHAFGHGGGGHDLGHGDGYDFGHDLGPGGGGHHLGHGDGHDFGHDLGPGGGGHHLGHDDSHGFGHDLGHGDGHAGHEGHEGHGGGLHLSFTVPLLIGARLPPVLDTARWLGSAGAPRRPAGVFDRPEAAHPSHGDVFVSYVREDSPTVDRLVAALNARGLDVWQDTRRIAPGDHWRRSTQRVIDECAAFVACFSTTFLGRDRSEMWAEIRYAVEELSRRPDDRAWFIPVLLDECPVPKLPIGANEHLYDIDAVHLYQAWDKGLADLTSVLRRLVSA
jgi:hypothetical protein